MQIGVGDGVGFGVGVGVGEILIFWQLRTWSYIQCCLMSHIELLSNLCKIRIFQDKGGPGRRVRWP